MRVVALPGRRIETAAWLTNLLEATGYADASVVRYRHWEPGIDASVAFEAERLSDRSAQLVIAKSLGTVVAATAYGANRFRPTFALFIGTPYTALEEDDLRLLRRFAANVTTLFIQQAEDPGGSARDLAAALRVDPADVAEVPGSDHLYRDVDVLARIAKRWQEQHPILQP